MMNVKKYRANSTREALEQVKMDLGEGAFVLETKQVRSGGFLGFKSATQIEISAAATPSHADSLQPRRQATSTGFSRAAQPSLSMADDSPARPLPQTIEREAAVKSLSAALNSRAALTDYFETSVPVNKSQSAAENLNSSREPKKIEAVELSSDAPRFVNLKRDTNIQTSPDQNLMETPATPENASLLKSREYEMLHAELRELKFSIGTMANRQNTRLMQDEIRLEDFGEVFDAPFYDCFTNLTATGITPDYARQIILNVIPQFKNGTVDISQLEQVALTQALGSKIQFLPNPLEEEKAVVMAIIGATGVGKTTTVAKLAAHITLYERRRVELFTLDTYRIAAVEQLKTYAEIIGAGCQVVRSVLELDAALLRLPPNTTALIDTTGRNPHDLADQHEFSDYLHRRPEIRKCLAIQATTNPHDGLAAIRKFEMYGADCLALTKTDETTRLGATVELVAESGLPLAYICNGQRVPEDWQIATPERFAAQILRQQT